jgi:Carboxypeptidase regulatory-like domain/TonB dependent receptor
MRNTFLLLILTLTVFIFSFVKTSAQQTDNGSLNGLVTDQNNAVITNATVTLTNVGRGTKRTATTNEEGRYSFIVLPLGEYKVKVEALNFQESTQTVTVVSGDAVAANFTLGITGGENVVDIVAESEELVNQNDSGTISTKVTGASLEKQPVIGRTPFGRLQQNTGTSGEIADPNSNGTSNPEVSVSGARTTSTGVQFNGISSTNISGTGSLTGNISPAPETVQEVNFLSSGYDASLGGSGGGSVQLTTRGGTNTYNGVAYMYAQNERFNSNDFFFNRDGIDRQQARRLEGGFTFGGRIIKDRLWFFSGYQKTDADTAYVPTAQSFVVLPEALAFITNRLDPQNVRAAFRRTQLAGGAGASYSSVNCVQILTPTSIPTDQVCIDPRGAGYRFFNSINPATGGYFIPNLVSGRYERLFVDPNNSFVTRNGIRITNFAQFGLPDGLPLLDRSGNGRVVGGLPLVRVRNVVPAQFKQDQITTRLDYVLSKGDANGNNSNTLNGTFFFANFPATDPFSTDTLASPALLIRDDRNRTLAITDTHIFSGSLINETRFGYFSLGNSRKLDDRFLSAELTNTGLGVINPASIFEPGVASQRAARFAGTGNLGDFSIGAPTDIYNQRDQVTLTFANNLTYIKGNKTFRFGFEHKRNSFDTNLPEEQSGEFEGLQNFTELFTSFVPEADLTFGTTNKQFRFNDLSFYASNDWRLSEKLTLNLGLRWDFFGLPIEKNGRFANFDISRVTNPENILSGFILPSNTVNTGFNAIDQSLPSISKINNKHTLNGQDLNNFAPRIGFAFRPFKDTKTVVRGGYGIFYDRPSAAFINTIYSNYPFFKEIELKTDNRPFTVQAQNAFLQQNPNTPFVNYFPFGVVLSPIAESSPFVLVDNTPGVSFVNGAEPLEFRAIDRDLKTPLIQQWNVGIQRELFKNWVVEARYVGTRGQQLLLAVGFNQPYDLNDPTTPDYIFGRLNRAFGSLPPALPGQTERQRGLGIVFGECNFAFGGVAGYTPCLNGSGGIDLNISPTTESGRAIIASDVRTPFLGLDPTDAIILQSRGYSVYHSGQLSVSRRLSNGLAFDFSYTLSKSIDIGSTDPGSTTASGRPDTPNLGLVVQGDQRDLNANRAVSDFDRPHRFAGNFTYNIPTFGLKSKFFTDWQLSGFGQWQSGSPFSIIASNASFNPYTDGSSFQSQFLGLVRIGSNRNNPAGASFAESTFNVGVGSGTIFNAAFGRPSIRSLELLRRQGSDPTRQYFNTCQDRTNPECSLLAPLGGFGNLGRNVLRGPSQKRFDISLQKITKFGANDRFTLEFKWDIFNVLNLVNFANPNADLSDETDFGQITKTVGSPRVMQFGVKFRF